MKLVFGYKDIIKVFKADADGIFSYQQQLDGGKHSTDSDNMWKV